MPKGKDLISPSERAALVERERALIRRMSRLLADRADELYRRADRVERGDVAPRLPRALSLAALAARVRRVGQADDPVTTAASARLAELSAIPCAEYFSRPVE